MKIAKVLNGHEKEILVLRLKGIKVPFLPKTEIFFIHKSIGENGYTVSHLRTGLSAMKGISSIKQVRLKALARLQSHVNDFAAIVNPKKTLNDKFMEVI